MIGTEDPIKQAQTRAERLERVMEGYELDPSNMFDRPNSSVPGAARVERTAQRYPCDTEAGKLVSHPRYVLVTQYGDRGQYRVTLAADLANVEQLARLAVCDGEAVWCFYDLDELAGPEPEITEGDTVAHPNAERFNLAPYVVERIELDQDDDPMARGGGQCWSCEILDVIERGSEDERMPVRYGLAKVVVSVVFNTIPSP